MYASYCLQDKLLTWDISNMTYLGAMKMLWLQTLNFQVEEALILNWDLNVLS